MTSVLMASWKAQYTNVVMSQDHLEGERRGRSQRSSGEKAEQTSSAGARNWTGVSLEQGNRQVGARMTLSLSLILRSFVQL